MKLLLALLIGILFGFGLSLPQMTNPLAVIGFLDITWHWDFRLALVMCSALLTTLVGYRFIFAKQNAPLFSRDFKLPTKTIVDWQLVSGATLFGIGWGLSGYCPGPAIASISINPKESLLFISAMVVGMKLKNSF